VERHRCEVEEDKHLEVPSDALMQTVGLLGHVRLLSVALSAFDLREEKRKPIPTCRVRIALFPNKKGKKYEKKENENENKNKRKTKQKTKTKTKTKPNQQSQSRPYQTKNRKSENEQMKKRK
jgi:hypothetical protein